MKNQYDLLIIGGGINGAAIARDAAGRGLSVCLCEKDDLAQHTSSASTKLVHGGLRYLEHFEFRLVRESLKEREVLLRAAPHIIWPMRFVLPHDKGLRPKWMLRFGLFLYDSLGGRELLPGTRIVNLSDSPHQGVLENRLKTGFEYSDCWVEDSRLVVLNAVDAKEHGADIFSRHEVKDIKENDEGYLVEVEGEEQSSEISVKGIVNAAGPWVERVLLKRGVEIEDSELRLVKGSHIVTKRLFEGEHSYIFQNADQRVIFAIPYEKDYTLIGTTDVQFNPGDELEASEEEITYLCNAANEYFESDISSDDVVWTYSGVRPLYDDRSQNNSTVTRDYVLNIDQSKNDRPFLSVYGGKITTSRKLAEHAMEKLESFYPSMKEKWTRKAPLPGGDIVNADFDTFVDGCVTKYPNIDKGFLSLLCRRYGTRVHKIFADSTGNTGQIFSSQLCEVEVDYLVKAEWAVSAEDILWRRTKVGLHMSEVEKQEFISWFNETYVD